MDTSVSRVFCFGLWRRLPLKLLEQSSAFLLFCSGHRPVGHVPHGQWARLGADILALIDPSACLVDPCTCVWHTKCAPHGPLTVSVVRPRREVFLRLTVRGTCPLTESEGSRPASERSASFSAQFLNESGRFVTACCACSSFCKLGGLCRVFLLADVHDVVTTSNHCGSLIPSASWAGFHTCVDSSCSGCSQTLCTCTCFSTN